MTPEPALCSLKGDSLAQSQGRWTVPPRLPTGAGARRPGPAKEGSIYLSMYIIYIYIHIIISIRIVNVSSYCYDSFIIYVKYAVYIFCDICCMCCLRLKVQCCFGPFGGTGFSPTVWNL